MGGDTSLYVGLNITLNNNITCYKKWNGRNGIATMSDISVGTDAGPDLFTHVNHLHLGSQLAV